jgi:uncharacterized delta-60 repeat protein
MKTFTHAILAILFFLTAHTAFATNAGSLDPTFGVGGKVYAIPANFMPAEDVAVQADGKLVLVGSTLGPDMTQDFGIVRLNADGSPDLGFGSSGLVGIPFDAAANEMATAVIIQSDGKIVVAGSVQLGSPGWDFGVVRLNSNGSVDGTYSGGKVKVNFSGEDFAYDMIVQPDDKVVITGTARPTPNKDLAIVRLTTTGALDSTFVGPAGRIFIDIGPGNEDEALGLARQSDGSLIMAGSTNGDFLTVRMTSAGAIDSTWGGGGAVVTPVGTQVDRAKSIAIQSDGKIVVAGTANSGSFDEAAFVRYSTTGTPDSSFDGDGKVTYDVRAMNSDIINSVLIQGDSKIIGVGVSGGQYILVRLNTNGSLDNSFGTGGKVAVSVAPGTGGAHRAVLQPDGKVVAVGDGSGTSPAFGFTAARFRTTPSQPAPFDFDGDGKTDVGIYRPRQSGAEWWINRSSNGQTFAVQFGTAPTIANDRLAPADYTGDGKTDIAYFKPTSGEWYILRSEDFSFFAFPFGISEDLPVPGDYDADGKADFAVYRPSSSIWYISQSSGAPTRIVQFGIAGDQPVVADYDGDGKADVAIFRNAAGSAQWWIERSTAGSLALQFGSSTDKAVQGDYTGDGKADVAIWRSSSGEWFILRSEDFSFYGFPFGTSGDVPAPGDYDGDAKFDATVFRPSNATWFIGRSTAGTQIVQFGATGDRPIPNAFIP